MVGTDQLGADGQPATKRPSALGGGRGVSRPQRSSAVSLGAHFWGGVGARIGRRMGRATDGAAGRASLAGEP